MNTQNSDDGSTTTGTVTPEAALARHVEWLDFALAAARSEETWRAARLAKATKKNGPKRSSRLDDVRAEIAELAALVAAIGSLRVTAAPNRRGRPPKAAAVPVGGITAAPKRRGRPPKAALAAATPSAQAIPQGLPPAAPNRRGRPPKAAAASAAVSSSASRGTSAGRPTRTRATAGTATTRRSRTAVPSKKPSARVTSSTATPANAPSVPAGPGADDPSADGPA